MQVAPDSRSPARPLLAVAAAVGLVAKRLLGAVVLGVATILMVKREPEQHWSEPPIIQMVDDYDQDGRSGEPDRSRLKRCARLQGVRMQAGGAVCRRPPPSRGRRELLSSRHRL